MSRRLTYIALFTGAFVLTLALSLPLDLLVARLIFTRAARSTGMTWQAGSVHLSLLTLPPSVEADDVTITMVGGTSVSVPHIRVQPGWGLLLGHRSLALRVEPGDGEIDLTIAGDDVRIVARDLRLERLPLIKLVTDWRYAGAVGFQGGWHGTTLAGATGEFTWEGDDLRLEGARLLGIDFPPTRLGRSRGRLTLANGALTVAEGQADGGSLGVRMSGQVALANPWRSSALGLTTSLTPTPEWEQALGAASKFLSLVRQPDGTLRLVTAGTIASPQVQFR